MSSDAALLSAGVQYELVAAPKPKPSADEIKSMLASYYDGLAEGFDEFNSKITRSLYLHTIDRHAAEELSRRPIKRLLSVASGTGHREVSIREMSGLPFQITCVDISSRMCQSAVEKGLDAICGPVSEVELPLSVFDGCLFLNAFEVMSSWSERLTAFQKISHSLKIGAPFFIDVMDLEDRNGWGPQVKELFERENLGDHGYELGDYFFRRTDQNDFAFAHYSSRAEMERLFEAASFRVVSLSYYLMNSGEPCGAGHGDMFFMAEKM